MKKPTINEEDIRLFRDTMKDVSPIKKDNKHPALPKKITQKRQQPIFSEPLTLDQQQETTVLHEEILFFSRSGIQDRVLKQLKQGKTPYTAALDLHKMTVTEAEQALGLFLNYAIKDAHRCVKVIHGKGFSQPSAAPILKNAVNAWLRSHPDILAFSSAIPKHGGTGALYLLLKKAG